MNCEKCGCPEPEVELNINSKIVWCKSCVREYNRKYYLDNKEDIKAHINRKRNDNAKINGMIIDQFKLMPCEICGYTFDIVCMDFDHIDPSNKNGNISHMMYGSFDKVLSEVCKCRIICANCHRNVSYESYGIRKFERTGSRARMLLYINSLKASNACQDCEKFFSPWQMDFDHREPSIKVDSITALVCRTGVSQEELDEEIDKCDLVCANCHRIRTYGVQYEI